MAMQGGVESFGDEAYLHWIQEETRALIAKMFSQGK